MDLTNRNKNKRLEFGDQGFYVEVRRLTWRESEDIKVASRDPKTGKIDQAKLDSAVVRKAITGFGGCTVGEKTLTFPADTEILLGLLYPDEAQRIYIEAFTDAIEASGLFRKSGEGAEVQD